MTKFLAGNIFLVISIIATSLGQVILKLIFTKVPIGLSTWESFRFVLSAERVWRTALAATLIVIGFMSWLSCLQRLPLSYAYPIACSSALVVAMFCVLFLGETVSWRLWAGTLLIALGSALVVSY